MLSGYQIGEREFANVTQHVRQLDIFQILTEGKCEVVFSDLTNLITAWPKILPLFFDNENTFYSSQ